MDILHGTNIIGEKAQVTAGGSVVLGNNVIIINLFEAAKYKELEKQLKDLNDRFITEQKNITKYPDDEYFKQQVLNISEQQNETKAKIDILKKEVLNLAEDFARIPINSERIKLAKEYFGLGEFDKARAILDAETMVSELNYLKKEQKILIERTIQNKQSLEVKSDEFMILARLTSIDFSLANHFEKSKEFFLLSISASRNINNIFDYATFLKENNQYTDAYALIPEIFESHKETEKNLERTVFIIWEVKILNLKGFLEMTQALYTEADATYRLALVKCRNVVKTIPEEITPILINLLNNLGSLCLQMKNYLDARSLTNESMRTFEKINNPNIDLQFEYGRGARISAHAYKNIFYLYVHETLNNKSSAWSASETGSGIVSESLFRKSMKTIKEISNINPDKYLLEYVKCLIDQANNLNNGHIETEEQITEIDRIYSEAITICREQGIKNPEVYLPTLSGCLESYGGYLNQLYSAFNKVMKNKSKEAKEALSKMKHELKKNAEEAIKIAETLYTHNPKTYLPILARKQFNLAVVYNQIDEIDKSIEYYQKSYGAYKILRTQDFEMYFEDSANVIDHLGTLYLLNNRFIEAEQAFMELHNDLLSLVKSGKLLFMSGIAKNLSMLSKMFKDDMSDKDKSLSYANQTIQYLDSLENHIKLNEDMISIRNKTLGIISYWKKSDGIFNKIKRLIS